ncbi:hypothetical protein F5148DRAFT_1145654 [Russula earlei]|uniref:Uncharacterized protein n=1 Tax=Russula earlei TaxID=71964 RepID=A0ACC0UN97_9AGAM|nr:hypothetical protein F5148DRAFT_1145654 [Russula earlei]
MSSPYTSIAAMDPSSDNDNNKCFSEQLDGSQVSPNAQKVTSYHILSFNISIILILIAGNFGDDDLGQILNAQLDTLAISPQAKQAIIPTLFGISKLIEVQSQGIPMPQLQFQPVSASLCFNCKVAMNTHPMGSLVFYQMHHCPFTSNSGSGYTTWFSGKSNTNIPLPPMVPEAKTGDLYVHFNTSMNGYQYWMLDRNNQWESISKGVENPLNHDQVLSIHSNGEPSWVTQASTTTTQGRKEREMQEKALACGPECLMMWDTSTAGTTAKTPEGYDQFPQELCPCAQHRRQCHANSLNASRSRGPFLFPWQPPL